MEVHQHSNVHYSKKWKGYLYEFLMLFLAVSAGFFMENLRERHVENERAEILAESLFDDIQKDTTALNEAIVFSRFKEQCIDSAIYFFHLPRIQWNDTIIYRTCFTASRISPFDRTQGTYEQLKSSGSLRYFKQSLVNLMNAYDVQAKKVIVREELDNHFIVEQVFPFWINNLNTEVSFDIVRHLPITHELYFNRTDETSCKEFINYLTAIKSLRNRSNAEYIKLKSIGFELLNQLKTEYHLENIN